MKQKQLQCNKQNRPVDIKEESLMGLGKNLLLKMSRWMIPSWFIK